MHLVDDADDGGVDGDEGFFEGQGGFARADEVDEIARAGDAGRVGGDLQVAGLAHAIVERLDDEERNALEAGVLARGDDGADDAAEVHRGDFTPRLFAPDGDSDGVLEGGRSINADGDADAHADGKTSASASASASALRHRHLG